MHKYVPHFIRSTEFKGNRDETFCLSLSGLDGGVTVFFEVCCMEAKVASDQLRWLIFGLSGFPPTVACWSAAALPFDGFAAIPFAKDELSSIPASEILRGLSSKFKGAIKTERSAVNPPEPSGAQWRFDQAMRDEIR